MLVLTRHLGQILTIGDPHSKELPIEIEVCGDQVRLGITAPRSVTVHRREIYDKQQEEKQD